jgi:hypothetical protein
MSGNQNRSGIDHFSNHVIHSSTSRVCARQTGWSRYSFAGFWSWWSRSGNEGGGKGIWKQEKYQCGGKRRPHSSVER